MICTHEAKTEKQYRVSRSSGRPCISCSRPRHGWQLVNGQVPITKVTGENVTDHMPQKEERKESAGTRLGRFSLDGAAQVYPQNRDAGFANIPTKVADAGFSSPKCLYPLDPFFLLLFLLCNGSNLPVTMDEGPRRLVSVGTESVVLCTDTYTVVLLSHTRYAILHRNFCHLAACYIGYEKRASPEFLLCAFRLKSGITPMHANAP